MLAMGSGISQIIKKSGVDRDTQNAGWKNTQEGKENAQRWEGEMHRKTEKFSGKGAERHTDRKIIIR